METIQTLYQSGMSIPQVSQETGVSRSTVRKRLLDLGVKLRTRSDAVRMAALEGRLGAGLRGKTRVFSKEHCLAISKARQISADKTAKGFTLKQSGYVEYTRGPNKGRGVHVVAMEAFIGRRIKKGECVHHIDENKKNNDLSNLALMSVSAHTRLHRLLDAKNGKHRERYENGRFR